MKQILVTLAIALGVTALMLLVILLLFAGMPTHAQVPLATPVLLPLQPPGYAPIATMKPLGPPPTYAPPTVRPTITPTPMWREVYYVRGYTPLWSVPARQYFIPFSIVRPGEYLMVENHGAWLVILNCGPTTSFTPTCWCEGLWVQNDWNVLKQ